MGKVIDVDRLSPEDRVKLEIIKFRGERQERRRKIERRRAMISARFSVKGIAS